MANILIVDDDPGISRALTRVTGREGQEGAFALTLQEGLYKVFSGDFDVVFLDINLPDGNGLNAMPKIKDAPSSPNVVIITGEGDADSAELAIRSGDWDSLRKPLSKEAIVLSFKRVIQYRKEKEAKKAPAALRLEGIIVNSPKMRQCYDLVARAGESESSVLISGETGAGKELFARALHEHSSRAG